MLLPLYLFHIHPSSPFVQGVIEKEAGKAEADCTSYAEKHGQTHSIYHRQVLLTKFEIIFTSICALSAEAACGQEELVIYSN